MPAHNEARDSRRPVANVRTRSEQLDEGRGGRGREPAILAVLGVAAVLAPRHILVPLQGVIPQSGVAHPIAPNTLRSLTAAALVPVVHRRHPRTSQS